MAAIENRYAEALIKIAVGENAVSEYEEQLQGLCDLVQSDDLKDILEHPSLNCSAKKKLIKDILGDKFSHHIISFYLILLDSGRYRAICEILNSYKKMSDEYKNINNIQIISSAELSDDDTRKVTDGIQQKFNLANVKIEKIIDPTIIGGIIVKIGDTIIDGTIKERLNKLKSAILN